MKLDKEKVDYRVAEGSRRCGNCSMFLAKTNTCTLVKGTIRAHDVCDRWEKKK